MNRITLLELEGKNYPLVYSIGAAEKFETAFQQPIDNIGDIIVNPEKYKIGTSKLIKKTIIFLINEGIEYCKYKGIEEVNGELVCMDFDQRVIHFYPYEDSVKLLNSIYECLTSSKKKK